MGNTRVCRFSEPGGPKARAPADERGRHATALTDSEFGIRRGGGAPDAFPSGSSTPFENVAVVVEGTSRTTTIWKPSRNPTVLGASVCDKSRLLGLYD